MRICQEQGVQFDPQVQYWFDEVAKKIGPPVGPTGLPYAPEQIDERMKELDKNRGD